MLRLKERYGVNRVPHAISTLSELMSLTCSFSADMMIVKWVDRLGGVVDVADGL